jgi:hypothetical protein
LTRSAEHGFNLLQGFASCFREGEEYVDCHCKAKDPEDYHHVRRLEQGAIQSDKAADLRAEEGTVPAPKSSEKDATVMIRRLWG